jgi:cystathionine beta-lyase
MKKTNEKSSQHIVTTLTQPAFEKGDVFKSLADGVERASTVVFDSVEKLRNRDWTDKKQYTYGLLGTPTSRRLESQLAAIDGVQHALLAPSGLAAISIVMMALLKAGDRVYLPNNIYVPALEFAKLLSKQYGVEYTLYNPLALDTLVLAENTTLVWVETPGSVTMEVADLPALANKAHAVGATVAIDATWAAGITLDVFKLGADISIQALTKYQSGGSDVMMGCVTTDDDRLYQAISNTAITMGSGVSPEDCRLILRSLPHYALRYHAQDQSARKIAQWCEAQPMVEAVLHPALKSSPGHDIWARDFTGAASLFSIVFKADVSQSQIDRCMEALALFHLGFSWGGAVSLVVPFTRDQMHVAYPYNGSLVRFYIGLENTDDLLADLKQAFSLLPTTN